MNRGQFIVVLIGALVLAGMFLCVPVSIHMMSLYFYSGDPNAGLNEIVFYQFLPEGWPRVINSGLLFWQCVFLAEIISFLVLAFKKSIKKNTSEINKTEKVLSFILITASTSIFFLWVVNTSMEYWSRFLGGRGLLFAGLLGLLATVSMIDVFVVKKRALLLNTTLMSLASLTVCMAISCSGHRYSQNEIQITPNLWRLIGVLIFLSVWMFYGIYQFIQKAGVSES